MLTGAVEGVNTPQKWSMCKAHPAIGQPSTYILGSDFTVTLGGGGNLRSRSKLSSLSSGKLLVLYIESTYGERLTCPRCKQEYVNQIMNVLRVLVMLHV